jgi:hypothetical protein
MVPGGEIIQFVGVLITGASLLGGLLSKYVAHPDDQYTEKVKKLQQDRWSEVSTELGEFLYEVRETVENSEDNSEEDLPPDAKFSLVIQREYNRQELGGLVEKIEQVDVPKTHFRTCRSARDDMFQRFVLALLSGGGAFGLAYFIGTNGAFGSLGSVMIGGAIFSFVSGLNHARRWQQARKQLDEMWEDYEFM